MVPSLLISVGPGGESNVRPDSESSLGGRSGDFVRFGGAWEACVMATRHACATRVLVHLLHSQPVASRLERRHRSSRLGRSSLRLHPLGSSPSMTAAGHGGLDRRAARGSDLLLCLAGAAARPTLCLLLCLPLLCLLLLRKSRMLQLLAFDGNCRFDASAFDSHTRMRFNDTEPGAVVRYPTEGSGTS